MKRTIGCGLLWIFLLCGTVYGATVQPPDSGNFDFEATATLTVMGRGEVSTAPDQAVLRLGAVAQAEKAAAAQSEVNGIVGRILQAVKNLGVPDRKISTVELSIVPVYGNQQPVPPEKGIKSLAPEIIGYRASDVIQVELDDLGKIGAVIDAGIGSGANRVEGLSFGLKNDSEIRKEALRRAAKNAAEKAEAVSKAMGVRLIGVQEITEGGVNLERPQVRFGAAYMKGYESTPVQPGQVRVEASLTVSYDVAQAEGRPPADQAVTSGLRKK